MQKYDHHNFDEQAGQIQKFVLVCLQPDMASFGWCGLQVNEHSTSY